MLLPLLLFFQAAASPDAVIKAATKYIPGVTWQAESIVTADFTCGGRKQVTILGTNRSEILVAIFLKGTAKPPAVFRDDVHDPASVELRIGILDYDPKEDLGFVLPGFHRSKRCMGLDISDGETDPLNVYWNHAAHRFDYWRN